MYSHQLRSFEVIVCWSRKFEPNLKLLSTVLPIYAVILPSPHHRFPFRSLPPSLFPSLPPWLPFPSPLLAPCRSLPYEMLMAELGRTTGQQVFQGNMRYSLTQAFGPDASLKAQAYLGVSYPHLRCMLLMIPQSVESMTDATSSKCMQCTKAKACSIYACSK